MAFPFLYMTLAINKLNGCGLSSTVCHKDLPKKTKVTQYLATDKLPDSINKSEHLNYKGKWVIVWQRI